MIKKIQLRTSAKDVLHPETEADMVLMPDGTTLTGNFDKIGDTWLNSAKKRFSNLKSITWTPKGTIPNASGVAYFVAGTTYSGIPYSSTRQIDKYVGYDVSFRTFLTAINNPYSVLYTENINGGHSTSIWGKTYLANECGPWMGIQCSAFVSYIVGLPIYWLTHQYNYAEKMGYINKLGRPFADNLQEMDILLTNNGHDLLVTEISRDDSGNISDINVSDSISPLPRTISYTKQSFDSTFSSDNYSHYRVNQIPNIMRYSEDLSGMLYNNDICTICGDYAAFRKGDTIAISYTADSYTNMKLYKDSTLIDTITINAAEHYVDLTSRNLDEGFYKAMLTDGNNNSNYTYFEVIETNVAIDSVNDKTVEISFSGSGKAEYIDFISEQGDSIARKEFTSNELLEGKAIIDVEKLASWMPRYSISGCYVKIKFRGTYGAVTSSPILVGI